MWTHYLNQIIYNGNKVMLTNRIGGRKPGAGNISIVDHLIISKDTQIWI
uniref:Uncharacterized protein n=1 Tax=Anguilla anguilla TaxID=7936 RepID=A0A0E9S9B0_ANGAN